MKCTETECGASAFSCTKDVLDGVTRRREHGSVMYIEAGSFPYGLGFLETPLSVLRLELNSTLDP